MPNPIELDELAFESGYFLHAHYSLRHPDYPDIELGYCPSYEDLQIAVEEAIQAHPDITDWQEWRLS